MRETMSSLPGPVQIYTEIIDLEDIQRCFDDALQRPTCRAIAASPCHSASCSYLVAFPPEPSSAAAELLPSAFSVGQIAELVELLSVDTASLFGRPSRLGYRLERKPEVGEAVVHRARWSAS